MDYNNVLPAQFVSRPNRFIAHCILGGGTQVVAHVKNTGRCKELLVPGARVYLEHHPPSGRKTDYSLVAVQKGSLLINIDSQAPNKVVGEALRDGALRVDGEREDFLRPEARFGTSRFDFYYETKTHKGYIEVKGVTLEENGVVLFPDAPTQRGVRHLEELMAATQQGYRCGVVFLAQLEHASYFTPNRATHPQFAAALGQAQAAGVFVWAYTCRVTPSSLQLGSPFPIKL